MSRSHQLAAVLVVVAVLLSACGGTSREDVLRDLATDEIVPLYGDLAFSTARLESATGELCEAGDAAALTDARAALVDARRAWSRSEPAWVGPAMERRSWAVIDWPIAAEEIEELLADESAELDIERIGKSIGADQRGLGALEYLLGDPSQTPGLTDRRCAYMTAVAEVIATEADLLLGDWTIGFEDGKPYTEQLADAGTTALDRLINDSLFLLEDVTDRELGAALGVMGRDADIDEILEGPAGLGASDIEQHLLGLRAVLLGSSGDAGLAPLLSGEIANRLDDQLRIAEEAVRSIDSPLRIAVVTDPDAVHALRDAVKEIQKTVATEVVSHLGVTIGFSDADGDTGA